MAERCRKVRWHLEQPEELIVSADSPEKMFLAFQAALPKVPKEIRRRLIRVMMSVSMSQGEAALHRRFNGRSVREILDLSADVLQSQPIASGEVDGMRFELFEKPGEPNGESPEGPV